MKLNDLHPSAVIARIDRVKQRPRAGVLFRLASCWIGAHWSPYNRRWCLNPLPFVTFWIALPGGRTP